MIKKPTVVLALGDFMETLQKQDARDTKCKSKNAASHLALAQGVWFGSGKWRIQVSAPVYWMLYHLKMQLIHSRRAQQPESSWNIYPLSHSSSYHSEKGGGRQRYVLKRLTDSTKSIWLCTCHMPKTNPAQSNCNRKV